MTICPRMDGKKCASIYCDLWNDEEQTCSLALESHKRVKILDNILDRTEKLTTNTKEKEDLARVMQGFNVVNINRTLQ